MVTVERIFQIMKEQNLSAKDFAKKVGLSQGNITDWKTGRAKPSTEALIKISNAYNISVDYLIGKSNLKVPLSKYNDFVLSNIRRYIISKYTDSVAKLELSEKEVGLFLFSIERASENSIYSSLDVLKKLKLSHKNDGKDKKISNLYNLICDNFFNMYAYSYSFIPLANNSNDTISNYYDNKAINVNIDSQDMKFVEQLMEKANNLFIDGPIHVINFTYNNSSQLHMTPVYGQISAGIPNWAEENIEGYLPIDPSLMDIVDPEGCFFLRVNGESMNKVIQNGAYALIRKTDWVENGEIAVVLVNGFDATLKKFSKQGDLVVLEPMSDDSSFQVQVYDKNTPIKVIGKYIGKFEMK